MKKAVMILLVLVFAFSLCMTTQAQEAGKAEDSTLSSPTVEKKEEQKKTEIKVKIREKKRSGKLIVAIFDFFPPTKEEEEAVTVKLEWYERSYKFYGYGMTREKAENIMEDLSVNRIRIRLKTIKGVDGVRFVHTESSLGLGVPILSLISSSFRKTITEHHSITIVIRKWDPSIEQDPKNGKYSQSEMDKKVKEYMTEELSADVGSF